MKFLPAAVCVLCLLSACITRRADHFYILSTQPQGASTSRTTPATQVALRVTVPSWVDRFEMVLNTSADGAVVLEHERWAAPLADLASQALARDLEQRRSDLLVTDSSANHAGALTITVNVVQVTVHRGGRASIDAHWRIVDPRTGKDALGGDVFSAPLRQDSYAAVAPALSECFGLLADRLTGQIRP